MDLRKELAEAIHKERFDVSDEGVFFPRQGVMCRGEYFSRVNGGPWQIDANRVVVEGLAHVLNVALGGKAKAAGYYLTLFNGAAAPDGTWTAANFAAVAGEIVSLTEGYSNPTRPAWTPVDTNGNTIDNFASVATFNIATTSEVTVTGAAMLTASGRGATTGVLVSASRYPVERKFQNTDVFDVGYRMSLTV